MNYYRRHIGDYLKNTAHLSLLEHGIYCRLLDAYYVREGPLPADVAATCRLVGASAKDERKAVESVLREFFKLLEDGWHQDRADREIKQILEKTSKAKASASARWKPEERDANGYANASANAMQTDMRTHSERTCDGNATQYPIPNTQERQSGSLMAAVDNLDPTTPQGRKAFFEAKAKAKPRPPDIYERANAAFDARYGGTVGAVLAKAMREKTT